jgi:hypothetical protein
MWQQLAVATTSSDTRADDPASYLAFSSLATTTGLATDASTAAPLVTALGAGQGVPLSQALGGGVRLVFEARGLDGRTRIFGLDSQDDYAGRDFNRSSATTCASTSDYASGGPCAPQVLIGVEGDPEHGNPRIRNARQMKLAWPTLDDWRWDGAPGRFMVFTTDELPGCAQPGPNHAYAVWDGTTWRVQYDARGCPRVFSQAQAVFPMHVGGARYKLYYGDRSQQAGKLGTMLPFLGPKQLLYADGASTGAPDVVDFDDWEPQSASRNVLFLWPNGEELDATAEGYIDDYHVLAPTADLSLQLFYVAITEGTTPPIAAAARLLNP